MTKPIADAADAKVVRESLETIQNEIQTRINLGFFDAAHELEATERQASKVADRLRELGYVVLVSRFDMAKRHMLNVSWDRSQPMPIDQYERDCLLSRGPFEKAPAIL